MHAGVILEDLPTILTDVAFGWGGTGKGCAMLADGRSRCGWANGDLLLARYHDEEWGVPPADDDGLFEALTLEIFQAGLSWRTVLRKREGFRRAFAGFALPAVAAFTADDIARLLADPRIVRHRGKIEATVHNARALLALQTEVGTIGAWLAALPRDPDAVYAALRPRLAFFGRTTCVSFLQAIGFITPPHEPGCWKVR